jgi:tetratricopeptide (TPR) repeat protein
MREYNNFGNCLSLCGKLGEAETCLQKAFEGRKVILGINNQSTLRTLDCLGVVYMQQNRVQEAYDAHKMALDGMKSIVGETHLFTWRATANLAVAAASLNNVREARELSVQALLNMEEILGPGARDTLIAAKLVSELHLDSNEDMSITTLQIAAEYAVSALGKTHSLSRKLEDNLSKIPERVKRRKKSVAGQGVKTAANDSHTDMVLKIQIFIPLLRKPTGCENWQKSSWHFMKC